MKKKSILLIGYDEHLCLSIVYCLRKANYTIHLLTHNKKRFVGIPDSSAKYSIMKTIRTSHRVLPEQRPEYL